MDAWLAGILGLFAGGIITAAIAVMMSMRNRRRDEAELANARTRAELLGNDLQRGQEEVSDLRAKLDEANQKREAAERRNAAHEAQLEAYAQAEKRLGETFASLGSKALQTNTDEFLKLARTAFDGLMKEARGDVEKKQQAIDTLIKPIRELLEKQNTAVADIEKKRVDAYGRLEEQIKSIAHSHEKLGEETGRLVTALRRSHHRGRWGELHLRNAVELAGMLEHCDFDEQVTIWSGDQRLRPDMIVHLPGDAVIPVDSKVALDAYLDALESDADKEACLVRHAHAVKTHVRGLMSKEYWNHFGGQHTPRLVVMFMPLESALSAALEREPNLHADAMQQHVLIATPTLLVALLRAVAYGWQQEAIARNAQEIAQVGRELYDRLATFVGHFERVGDRLNKATASYNSAIGSLERMVLPGARKLKELRAADGKELESPPPIEIEVRKVTAPELKQLEAEEERATG